MAKNRRRAILINPSFQLRFLVYLNIILFLCLSLYSWIILEVAKHLVDLHFITENKAKELNQAILPYIALVHLVIHILMSGVMLFVSHRIAGPLLRFKNIINSLIRNNFHFKPINTRKHDYFDELKQEINKLNTKMREDYLDKQELVNTITQVLQEPISQQSKKQIEELIKKHQ